MADRQMIEHIRVQIRLNLNAWSQQISNAIKDAPEPDRGSGYWWVALIGNLIWAATCLADTEVLVAFKLISSPGKALPKWAVIPMSFVGAAIGSGTVEKMTGLVLSPNATKEDFTRALDEELAIKLGEAENSYFSMAGKIADEFVQGSYNRASGFDEIDDFVWNSMFAFPIYDPYAWRAAKQKYNLIYLEALHNVQELRQEFEEQYQKWSLQTRPRTKENWFEDDTPFQPDLTNRYNLMWNSIMTRPTKEKRKINSNFFGRK